MTRRRKYTTELSKGQGMVSETLALLRLWNPSVSVAELKSAAVKEGVIGRATALRVQDIVGRVFAPRYLRDGAEPARNIKTLLEMGVPSRNLIQVFLIHTARAHPVLHDFITEVYWPRYAAGARQIRRENALDFIEKASNNGLISPPWSETMMLRVARYLTGCLTEFQLAGKDRAGKREIVSFDIQPLTILYLAHEIHFSGFSDNALMEHEDWGLFGLEPLEVRNVIERAANGHFIPQFSGDLVRISWKHKTMEEALRGIAAAGL